MTFPTNLDTFPSAATLHAETLEASVHSDLHGNLGAAVSAIEAKVGVDGSGVTTSHDYILSSLGTAAMSDTTDFDAAGTAATLLTDALSITDLTAITSAWATGDLLFWYDLSATTLYKISGDDLAKAVASFKRETVTVSIQVTDPAGSALTTGDGKAYFRVPSTLTGFNLTAVAAHVTTVSSSGLPTVQLANVTDAVDMLSTKVTIDASEKDSSTAATPAVIDAAHDDVATGDELRVDVDVAGTGTKGLIVEMQFALP